MEALIVLTLLAIFLNELATTFENNLEHDQEIKS